MKGLPVVLIPGDGIGPEVSEAVQLVFEAARVPVEWVVAHAGLGQLEVDPSGLPHTTLDSVRKHRVALKGPTTTPSGKGHQSVNVQIRRELGLYANVRPSRSISALPSRYSNVDLIIVRENIEDTYGGIEYRLSRHHAQGTKLLTHVGATRAIHYAFELARRENRKSVTCVHKANIHKFTDGLFLESFETVRANFPEIESRDILVDNLALQLVTNPARFDVLVLPNLYGDIVSDLCAGLVGGLGVAPAGNIGDSVAVFEAVHGSAPDIAGMGIANPTALILSACMMLKHLGGGSYAKAIEQAILSCFEDGEKTRDLGGTLSTFDFAKAISVRLGDVNSDGTELLLPDFSSLELLPKYAIAESVLHGVEVSVRSPKFPALPSKLAEFELEGVWNRGTRVESDNATIALSDVYQVRYKIEGKSPASLEPFLNALSESGVEWVQIQKLEYLNGIAAYHESR
ncbi:MAG: NAD-dependent isocitrate dehydrogenase [Bdellovibrionales bacterium]|nr:NAD-dependent isocitrate dehydrogenase [Bdellovibrionales bacterium]